MQELTNGQRKVFEFIVERQRQDGFAPTTREIQTALGLNNQTSVVQFLRALRKKGYLRTLSKRARGAIVATSAVADDAAARPDGRSLFVDVPLRGDIQAGLPVDGCPQTGDTLPVLAASMGLTAQSKPFALRARGDSMTGAGILDGDYVVLDAAREARSGDVVAALIDGGSTLKRYVVRAGKPYLKAENPKYPKLNPVRELHSQGVMVGLIRGSATTTR